MTLILMLKAAVELINAASSDHGIEPAPLMLEAISTVADLLHPRGSGSRSAHACGQQHGTKR